MKDDKGIEIKVGQLLQFQVGAVGKSGIVTVVDATGVYCAVPGSPTLQKYSPAPRTPDIGIEVLRDTNAFVK